MAAWRRQYVPEDLVCVREKRELLRDQEDGQVLEGVVVRALGTVCSAEDVNVRSLSPRLPRRQHDLLNLLALLSRSASELSASMAGSA